MLALKPLVRRLWGKPGARRVINWIIKRSAERYHDFPEKRIIISYDGGAKLAVHPADWIGALIYWRGHHMNFTDSFLGDIIRSDMVIADVGANIGEFAVYFAKRVPQGRVLAFEPVPSNRSDLMHNIRLNGLENVEVFPFALSDKAGEGVMFTHAESDVYAHYGLTQRSGSYTLVKREEYGVMTRVFGTFETKTMDEACVGLARLDLIKVDVEGADLAVLQGGTRTIKRFRPILFVECNEAALNGAGKTGMDLIGFIKNLGYRIYWPYRSLQLGTSLRPGSRGFPVNCDLLCMPDSTLR